MKKIYTNALMLLAPFGMAVFAQNNAITVNKGQLYVLPNTLIATHANFENRNSGIVFNDGEFQFYKNYTNNGLFTHTTSKTTGYTVFQGNQEQLIAGEQPSKHFDVLFNNSVAFFNLNSDIIINGTGNFNNGIVKINNANGGQMMFGNNAKQINASDKSYAQGMVEKQGANAFTFPIGKEGFYRMAAISAPENTNALYTSEYFIANTNNMYPHKDKTGIIEAVDNAEYWQINKADATTGSVIVTLSWHQQTTPAAFSNNANLHVVRWDAKQNLWVDEGGIVDMNAKTITTPVNVEGFGIFTIGKIKEKYNNPGDVVIYNGVSADNDGVNDYFIIDNINYFPDNSVTIFNRWGRKVFETTNYNSNGNVFKGYVSTNQTTNTKEKLPSGTYYYVVEYLYNRNGENKLIKKVGHLHLENNN
ncbi:gliding motility-associated C-terminal domain-containing protein [Myroides sp. JBRI-B21084]|uniref:gliding motility-associated C-terminal domain-containing protein n=1 Tax=Myroides sp. JBRI-B21084 TaxID=3119977 RepID=UPI0026E3BDAF|nr:gliding motility-associated C-terminal domain-containing protein [Paenimyroides cloacae]WKW46575.1 gliding motility-associated C-terminal domain-containing protein [Paenimyroides cloacae]